MSITNIWNHALIPMPNARTNEKNKHRLNKHRPLGLYAVPRQAKAAVRILSSVYRDKSR